MSRGAKEINSPNAFRSEVETLIRWAHDTTTIANMLGNAREYTISISVANGSADIAKLVEVYAKAFSPYKEIQSIMENILIAPTDRPGHYVYDIGKETLKRMDMAYLDKVFLDKNALTRNMKPVPMRYMPRSPMGLLETPQGEIFNCYKAPKWLDDIQKGRVTLAENPPLPEFFRTFLMHLCAGDLASVEFILDWMAISLQARNKTYLCLVGAQGIGKGMLCKLIQALHGDENSLDMMFASLMKQFNGMMADKTFILLDEISQITKAEDDKLKKQNDDLIEVERKGKESDAHVKNHSNIALASNHFDALRVDGKRPRRLSLPTLTTEKIQTVFNLQQIMTFHTDQARNTELAHFLMRRKYKEERISEPFESEQYRKILNASSVDWEKWFMDEFCKEYQGHVVSCRSAIEFACTKFRKANITNVKLSSLEEKFPGIFRIAKTDDYEEFTGDGALITPKGGKRVYAIAINELKNQKNYDTVETEDQDGRN